MSAGAPPRRSWRGPARLAVLLVFLIALAVALRQRWADVRPLLGQLSLPATGLATACILAGVFCSFLTWRAILADFGATLPLAAGMRIFFLGQLGKYLPGSIWPVAAQMELGRDYRVPRRASGAAVVVTMLVILGTGLPLALLALTLSGPAAFGRYWWLLVAVPTALVLLHPRVLNRLIGLVLRLARRKPMPTSLTSGGMLRAAGWAVAMWWLYGAQVWALAHDLGVTAADLLLHATGAFAAAWCIGFLLVIAPAGLGVREPALVLLLTPVMPSTQALVVSLLSRLLFTVGDLGWCGAAVLVRSRRPVPAADAAAPPDATADRPGR
jgi:uncharacterized membrane protein YbhN (UPF0104 family)